MMYIKILLLFIRFGMGIVLLVMAVGDGENYFTHFRCTW